MRSKFFMPLIACGALVLTTGCNKNMKQFAADYFTTNPNPLELVGNKVPATVTGNIPAKFFVKNAEVTVTPVLVYNGQESTSMPYKFQGEKVRGNNTVVSYDNGGYMTIPVGFDWNPAMIKSELYLNFDVQQGNKQYTLPRVKVADGVIATASFSDATTVNPALAPDAFQRIINEQYTADIRFLINVANLRKSQLDSNEVLAFNTNLQNANADDRRVIQEVNVKSYASPDGPMDFNTRLAEQREQNTLGYIQGQLKKDNITEFGELTAQFTPEDWEGFQELVAASNIQDKDLILSVLKMYKDPAEREREIRNMSAVFEELAETILPQLRSSRMTAIVDVIGKSDAEIEQAFNTDPSSLTIEELLYAASLTKDNNRRKAIYEAATKLYPNDARAFNDLGMVQYLMGDYDNAKKNFAKAAQLDPKNAHAQMNQGLIALMNSDFSTANRYFGNAAGLPELNDALGVYYLQQGDANAAVRAFGDTKSNNAALAQILTKDYNKAKNTLSAIAEPNAVSYYLMAVIGARTNNAAAVESNLRKAFQLDPALRDRALQDLEFANFSAAL